MFIASLQFFLTAQNLKLFGQKLHFSNDAFQSYYDLFQTRRLKNVIFVQTLYNCFDKMNF